LIDESSGKSILFHHGHFLEDIYTLMSTVKTYIFPNQSIPEDIWDIEKENFAWIDFFWSTMGRSGQVGKGVELIYDKMTDEDKFSELLITLLSRLHKILRRVRTKRQLHYSANSPVSLFDSFPDVK
jgi:hypothetical protein